MRYINLYNDYKISFFQFINMINMFLYYSQIIFCRKAFLAIYFSVNKILIIFGFWRKSTIGNR